MLQYQRRRFFILFDRTWLRSGNDSAHIAQYLTAGEQSSGCVTARRFSVRPALYKKASPWGEAPLSGDEGVMFPLSVLTLRSVHLPPRGKAK